MMNVEEEAGDSQGGIVRYGRWRIHHVKNEGEREEEV
jgi:hypothetical protein